MFKKMNIQDKIDTIKHRVGQSLSSIKWKAK